MNQVKKKLYKQRHKQEIANVKQLLLSDDSSNNMIGLMLAVTQLKWGSERIARVVMNNDNYNDEFIAFRRNHKFNNVEFCLKTDRAIRRNIYQINYRFEQQSYNIFVEQESISNNIVAGSYYNIKSSIVDYIEGLIKRNIKTNNNEKEEYRKDYQKIG